MINATDLKAGESFLFEGKPYQVIKYSLIKMGRNGALVKVTVRNIESGSVEEKSFSSNLSLEEVITSKRKLQYLYKTKGLASSAYKDAVNCVFMDLKTFEQVEIPLSVLGEQVPFLKEGEGVDILFWEEKPLSILLSPNVVMTVSQTDPGVKGNSATNIYKPARLENGMTVKVPLFIKQGDKIKVDTRTGEYVERVKE